MAPTAGPSVMPAHDERAGGERDRDDVVPRAPRQVLHHLPVARVRQRDHADDAARVRRREHDTGRLDRDVGAGADRDPDVGARERRRVVHTVADHRHAQPARLELGDLAVLVLGEHLGEHLVDADVAARPRRRPAARRR